MGALERRLERRLQFFDLKYTWSLPAGGILLIMEHLKDLENNKERLIFIQMLKRNDVLE